MKEKALRKHSTRKQQPRFYWSCSSVLMNIATPLTSPSAWADNWCLPTGTIYYCFHTITTMFMCERDFAKWRIFRLNLWKERAIKTSMSLAWHWHITQYIGCFFWLFSFQCSFFLNCSFFYTSTEDDWSKYACTCMYFTDVCNSYSIVKTMQYHTPAIPLT